MSILPVFRYFVNIVLYLQFDACIFTFVLYSCCGNFNHWIPCYVQWNFFCICCLLLFLNILTVLNIRVVCHKTFFVLGDGDRPPNLQYYLQILIFPWLSEDLIFCVMARWYVIVFPLSVFISYLPPMVHIFVSSRIPVCSSKSPYFYKYTLELFWFFFIMESTVGIYVTIFYFPTNDTFGHKLPDSVLFILDNISNTSILINPRLVFI